MIREQLSEALREATAVGDDITVGTLRLILAALRDRETAHRSSDSVDDISESEMLGVLQDMVRQRRESIQQFRADGRDDLADREEAEIDIIERFMPAQLSDEEIDQAVKAVIADLGAGSFKDLGRTMTALKKRYNGRMDMNRAGVCARERLGKRAAL